MSLTFVDSHTDVLSRYPVALHDAWCSSCKKAYILSNYRPKKDMHGVLSVGYLPIFVLVGTGI